MSRVLLICIFFANCFTASSQRVSTSGKEFYISFYRNGAATVINDTALQLFITSKVNTSGTVTNPNSGYSLPFSVNANTVTKLFVPAAQGYNAVINNTTSLGLIVSGSDTLSVSALNTLSATSDATLVLQTNALGTEYVVVAYTGITGNPSFVSAFMIEATEDQTEIEITPSVTFTTGQPAGTPFTVILKKGQTYFNTATGDLSGTRVKVLNSCKRIAVFGGATGAQVPLGQVSADHLFEQMFPINSFGNKFITPKYLGRNTARIKIVAPYNGTTIKVDGVTVANLNANGVYENANDNKPRYIESNNPIQLCLFANGQQYDNANGPTNAGDPSMMLIQPIEQQINESVFISPNVGNVNNHRFSVVCKTVDVATMFLDGSSIAASFQPVTGNLNYSAAALNVITGQHIVSNPNGFSGYVYGFGQAQGYSYSTGSYVEAISNHFICNGFSSADTLTVKVCRGPTTFTVLAEEQNATFSWDFGDGSPIVTTSGLTLQQIHNFANTGNYLVTLTITSSCTPMPIVRQLKVKVLDQILPAVSIIASPNATVCSGTPIVFRANVIDGGVNPTYQWKVNGINVGTNDPQYTSSSIMNGDIVQCVVTSSLSCSNGATATATYNASVINSLTPSIQIAANSNQLCAGTPVNLTATAGGNYNNPTFVWKVNGITVGTNSVNFSYTPANNDVITCTVNITESCATTNTAVSNSITMQVFNNAPNPSISIQLPQNSLCNGSVFNFTSINSFGGSNPSFQWRVNGNPVGSNSASFSSSTLSNNDVVTCVMTSNASCISSNVATSNSIVVNVLPLVQPSISISSVQAIYCVGDTVKLNSLSNNEGNNPLYEWFLNSNPIGGPNTANIQLPGLQNNDTLYCKLISSVNCAINPVYSNKIVVRINNPIIPIVSLQASKIAICENESVQLNITTNNASPNSSYSWYWNNTVLNNSGLTFTTSTIKNNDSIYVIVKSNSFCVNDAKSNTIYFSVQNNPVVSFSNSDTIIKYSSGITLNPIIQSGSSISTYLWQPSYRINSTNIKNPLVNPLQNTLYTLTVKDQAGCTGQAAIKVNLFGDLLLPNVFSPNNDGVNDVFKLPDFFTVKIDYLTIYNRWGQVVFHTNDATKGWNGLYKGATAPLGNYIWMLKYYDPIQKMNILKKGNVILAR